MLSFWKSPDKRQKLVSELRILPKPPLKLHHGVAAPDLAGEIKDVLLEAGFMVGQLPACFRPEPFIGVGVTVREWSDNDATALAIQRAFKNSGFDIEPFGFSNEFIVC